MTDLHTQAPPHSDEAEISVLGGMMIEEAAIDDVQAVVSEDDFYHPAHRLIYAAIGRLREQGHTPDALAVREELKRRDELEGAGGDEHLAKIVDIVSTAANASYHARVVLDAACKRRLIQAAGRIIGLARNGDTAGDVCAEAERMIFAVGDQGPAGESVAVPAILEETLDRIERREEDALSLPWPSLNRTLGGGVHRGELVIVAGRPSHGKSQFLLSTALTAARRGTGALIVDLELGPHEVARRLLGLACHLPAHLLKRSARRTEDEEIAFQAGCRILSAAPIELASAHTIAEIQARARRFSRKHEAPLLVLDYVQLAEGEGETRNNQVGSVSRGLKHLARDLDGFVACGSQLNREVEHRQGPPRLADLRDSGSLEQDADAVLVLDRPAFNKVESETDPSERGLVRVWTLKNRSSGGGTGVDDLHLDIRTGELSERSRRTP